MSTEPDYQALDDAWQALNDGEAQRALDLARGLDDNLREVWLVRATAALDLDLLRDARAAVARAAALEGDELDVLLVQAEVDLRDWRIDEATKRLERALEIERSPAVLARLALCRDLAGEFCEADGLLEEAAHLDPENFPVPPRMSDDDIERVMEAAIASLPEPFQQALDEVQVSVEQMPTRELLGEDLSETAPDLLGLFTGVSKLDGEGGASLEMPPTIHLFQRNLERGALDTEELVDEIHVTLYHELAHYLGFDEDGVADMGLE